MSTIITEEIPRQADVYPLHEWLWRGIVDPTLFGGEPGLGAYNPLINYKWSTTVSSDYITDGVELVVNGGFDTDSDWTKGVGWTIANGVASCDGTQTAISNMSQALNISLGDGYIIIYTISGYTSGSIKAYAGFGAVGTTLSSDGQYSQFLIADGNTTLYIQASIDFIGSLDNISVQKVIQQPNTMYLQDSGTSPKYPAEMFSGQGVEFNGVDQSVTVGVSSDWNFFRNTDYTVMFNKDSESNSYLVWLGSVDIRLTSDRIRVWDGTSREVVYGNGQAAITLTYTHSNTLYTIYSDTVPIGTITASALDSNSGLGIGHRPDVSYGAGTLKDLYIFNRALTPTEISKYSTDPNGFFQDVQDGVIDNCVLNMPLNGKDKYQIDHANYSETSFYPNNIHISSGTKTQVGNTIVWDVTQVTPTDRTYTPQIVIKDSNHTDSSKRYLIDVKLTVISGEVRLGSSDTLNSSLSELHGVYQEGSNKTLQVVDCFKTTSDNRIGINFDGLDYNNFTFKLEVTISELSGIYEIANHTVGANVSNLNYGTQELNFTRDGLWRGDLSSYLECDGVGYVDTGWIPPSDSDFALWFNLPNSDTIAEYQGLGIETSIGDNGNFFIRVYGGTGNGSITGKFGGSSFWLKKNNPMSDIFIKFSVDSGSVEMYEDGNLVFSAVPIGLDLIIDTFFVGALHKYGTAENHMTRQLSKFQVHTDTTKALEDYLAQYE